jgi:hypothetical protein
MANGTIIVALLLHRGNYYLVAGTPCQPVALRTDLINRGARPWASAVGNRHMSQCAYREYRGKNGRKLEADGVKIYGNFYNYLVFPWFSVTFSLILIIEAVSGKP